MIPNNVVTRSAIRDSYQNYDATEYNPFIYKVRAGLDIRDTELGMDVADWKLWFDVELKTFNLDRDDKTVLELGVPGYGKLAEGVAFAFDGEMRLYWGYTYLDMTKEISERCLEFNWYNPEQNRTIKMILQDVHSMHVLFDDKRISNEDTNDIILFYVRGSDRVVCARYQRDLFAVEYPLFLLRTGEKFVRVDVTTKNQIQFEIGKLQKPYTWVKLLGADGLPIYDHNRNPIWVVENTMSDSFNYRVALSDLTYQRAVEGSELFIINYKGEERQLSLTNFSQYLQASFRLDSYYKKNEADDLFAFASDVYTKSESHDLFEVKGAAYDRFTSDGKYALKENSYTKTDINVNFARKDEVYNRTQADNHFATKDESLNLTEADNRYVQKTEYVKPTTDMSLYLSKAEAIIQYATADSVYTAGYIDANFVNIKRLDNYYTKEEVEQRLVIKNRNIIPVKDNLIYNGVFEQDNLDGWNGDLSYTKILSPRSAFGGAVFRGKCKRLLLDQMIPVLYGKNYDTLFEYRYINKVTPGVGVKLAFRCFDSDKKLITGLNYSFDHLSKTRLAAPLKIGDTVMKVESTNGWLSRDKGITGFGSILFFNYKNQSTYSYTDVKTPYTRNIAIGEYVKFKSSEASAPDEFINKTTNTITLAKPWDYKNPNTTDGSFPIGTTIARSRPYYGSDEYEIRCRGAVGLQFNSPDTGAIVSTKNFDLLYNDTGRYHDLLLPPATVYLQPVLYPNFNYMGDKTEYGLELSVAPDATDQDIVAITQLYLRLNMK